MTFCQSTMGASSAHLFVAQTEGLPYIELMNGDGRRGERKADEMDANSTLVRCDAHTVESIDFNTGKPSKYPTEISAAWVANGRKWRRRTVWCYPGYRTFLDVLDIGDGEVWHGSGY